MQTRLMSFVETVINIITGYAVAVITQLLVFPLFDIFISLNHNLLLGLAFAMISLIRSYVLRRLFNMLSGSNCADILSARRSPEQGTQG